VSDMKRQNIENLSGFWRRLGARPHPLDGGATLFASRSWPHRRWLDWSVHPTERQSQEMGAVVRDDRAAVVPSWHGADSPPSAALRTVGFDVGFSLLAMHRPGGPVLPPDDDGLRLQSVTTDELADEWTRVASASFGYVVDPTVIRGAFGAPDLHLMIARHNGEPVGTVSLFDDKAVTGIHMMGVLPSHRRRGHARSILHRAIARTTAASGRDLVLQASAAGAPLYRSVGFEEQFAIPHFVSATRT
jgi:GNAT superfamily N-acetyltransferase